MNDDILGLLNQSDRDPNCLEGQIEYQGRNINISIDPDGKDPSLSLQLARDLVEELSKYDLLSREVAANHLLDEYNGEWRKYQENNGDGKMEDVVDPELSSQEFINSIKLTAIGITGDSLCDLYFDDGGLFTGHSIIVTSLNGLNFSDIHADLFG